jgi:hypothetical protein
VAEDADRKLEGSWELFDLETDPMELNNIYGHDGYEELTDSLRKILLELQVKYGEEQYSNM